MKDSGDFPWTDFPSTKIMSFPVQENYRQVLDSVSCKKFEERIILLMNFTRHERCVEFVEYSSYNKDRFLDSLCFSRCHSLQRRLFRIFCHSHQRQFFNRKTHIYSSLSLTCLIKFVKNADDPMDWLLVIQLNGEEAQTILSFLPLHVPQSASVISHQLLLVKFSW